MCNHACGTAKEPKFAQYFNDSLRHFHTQKKLFMVLLLFFLAMGMEWKFTLFYFRKKYLVITTDLCDHVSEIYSCKYNEL